MPRPSTTTQVLILFVFGYVLVAGEPGLLIGMMGAALCAWEMARQGSVVLRSITRAGPAVAVWVLRQSRLRVMVPRQEDPDAAGHTRSRAPSVLLPTV